MLKSQVKGKQLIDLEKKLFEYAGEDRIISSTQLADMLKNEKPPEVIKSKLPELDDLLNGFEAGELILVTGPTGQGKTTFLQTLTKNMDVRACWFSFEVTQRQFFQKFNFNPPLFYLPAKNVSNTLEWLEERIIESTLKYPEVKVIFIDHLHFLFNLGHIKNTSLELGDMIAKVKQIALLNNLVIFLVAHPQKKAQDDKSDPHHDDIRDSSLVAQYADTCIAIWRVSNDYTIGTQDERSKKKELTPLDNKSVIRITKNRRNGKLGRMLAYCNNGFLTAANDFQPIIKEPEKEINIFDIPKYGEI